MTTPLERLVLPRYSRPEDVHPAVRQIVGGARSFGAHELVRDHERLDRLRGAALWALGAADALLLPTAPFLPTIPEVAADPIHLNRRLGRLCAFANPFGLAAVSVPAGSVAGVPFGVTVYARAFGDRVAADVGKLLLRETAPAPSGGTPLLVFGAHMTGQPLNGELTARGARFVARMRTEPRYRMYALATEPPKPGVVDAGDDGAALEGELWQVPGPGLATLLASLPEPMTLGSIRLEDGSRAVGFFCHAAATDAADEITHFGSWRRYLRARVGAAA